MLKIWLKLVLKGRCARKSRPLLEGLFGRDANDWSQFEAFRKNSLFFLFFAGRHAVEGVPRAYPSAPGPNLTTPSNGHMAPRFSGSGLPLITSGS